MGGSYTPDRKDLDVSHSISGCASCAPACTVFAIDGFHVTRVEARSDVIVLFVETDLDAVGCPGCGVVAEGQGRRVHELADAPAFGLPVRVRWRKRLWRCLEVACSVEDLLRDASVRDGAGEGHDSSSRLGDEHAPN